MLWAIFGIVIVAMLVLDLGVLNRRPHAVTVKEALAGKQFEMKSLR